MKLLTTIVFAVASFAVAAMGTASPARADASFGIYVGGGPYYGGYYDDYRAYCRDPWYRHRYAYYCDRYYYGYYDGPYYGGYPYYGGPAFFFGFNDHNRHRHYRHRGHWRGDWGGHRGHWGGHRGNRGHWGGHRGGHRGHRR